MKRNAIARIIVYSLIVLALTSFLIAGILSNGFVFSLHSSSGTVVDYEARVDAAPIEEISINWVGGTVVIKAEDVDHIIFRETCPNPIKKQMTYRCADGVLELNHSQSTVSIGINHTQDKDLVVIVPLNWSCQELSIHGTGVSVTIADLSIGNLEIDGAGTALNFSGSIHQLEVNGAGCDIRLDCSDRPKNITLDGAGCVLSLTLPEHCGFQLEMDGLGCELDTSLSFRRQDGVYLSGDGYCKIEVNGIGCDIAISEAAESAHE